MEQHTTNFGARLRALIDGKKISLAQFADEFEMSESQLHNWLKRTQAPLEKHWQPLADYFNVSYNYIGLGTPEKSEPEVGEPHGDYGAGNDAAGLRRLITLNYDSLMEAAGDDVARLGWIAVQQRAHLTPPAHWLDHDEINRRAEKMSLEMTEDYQRRKREALEKQHLADTPERAAEHQA